MCSFIDDLRKVPVHVIDKIGDKVYRQPVPDAMHYEYCGRMLKKLSRYEYAALVKLTPKSNDDSNQSNRGRHAVQRFALDQKHPCHIMKSQMLKAKQSTVVFCDRLPPIPGPKPDDSDSQQHDLWRKKADAFAK